jgi:hypothetical protein
MEEEEELHQSSQMRLIRNGAHIPSLDAHGGLLFKVEGVYKAEGLLFITL